MCGSPVMVPSRHFIHNENIRGEQPKRACSTDDWHAATRRAAAAAIFTIHRHPVLIPNHDRRHAHFTTY